MCCVFCRLDRTRTVPRTTAAARQQAVCGGDKGQGWCRCPSPVSFKSQLVFAVAVGSPDTDTLPCLLNAHHGKRSASALVLRAHPNPGLALEHKRNNDRKWREQLVSLVTVNVVERSMAKDYPGATLEAWSYVVEGVTTLVLGAVCGLRPRDLLLTGRWEVGLAMPLSVMVEGGWRENKDWRDDLAASGAAATDKRSTGSTGVSRAFFSPCLSPLCQQPLHRSCTVGEISATRA